MPPETTPPEPLAAEAPRPLAELVRELELDPGRVAPYGRDAAKLDHRLGEGGAAPSFRTVLVTAVTPTPAGEGKTVHTVGLAMALARAGRRAVCAIRQPSMGPVFGVKGGGSGGGRSQVVPADRLNLHLTGDIHAVAAATNLLAAATDTSLLLDNPLRLVPERIYWRRVVDVNDRALREIEVGLGGARNGVPRRTSFDIAAASEVMSVLALATGWGDLRRRLGALVVGENAEGEEVRADDVGAAGAMAALLRDALDPNLLQTSEGTPALVHAGPFANISTGNSSVVADRVAGRLADYLVTEAGFGADMGAEKFFNIKCRVSGIRPDAAVLVATVRALKVHSGEFDVRVGRPLPPELSAEDPDALRAGASNLAAQIANVRRHGVPVVVAVNRFPGDTPDELDLVCRLARDAGARDAVVSEVFARGGAGGETLAEAVVAAAESGEADFRHAYELERPLGEKIETLAREIYGADGVELSSEARADLERLEEHGHGRLPVCVAKTQYSLSHDPALRGRPQGFTFPIRGVRLAAGAGFVVPLAGAITTMPGLGRSPAYRGIDVRSDGRITGLA